MLCCCIFSEHAVVHQLLFLNQSADELPCRVRSMPLSASTGAQPHSAYPLSAAAAATATAAATAAAAAPTLPPLRGWGEQRLVLD